MGAGELARAPMKSCFSVVQVVFITKGLGEKQRCTHLTGATGILPVEKTRWGEASRRAAAAKMAALNVVARERDPPAQMVSGTG